MTRPEPLHSVHRSMKSRSPKPRGLSFTILPDDSRLLIEREALDIFTVMVNSGATLQETLAAVFLSGMNAAHSVGGADVPRTGD